MKKFVLACSVSSLALTGCIQSDDTSSSPQQTVGAGGDGISRLIYSFPTQEQGYVPTSTPVYLHFSSTVDDSDLEDGIEFLRLNGDSEESISFSAQVTDSGRSVVITPDEPLRPSAQYRVSADGVQSSGESVRFPEDGVEFVTRASLDGPLAERMSPINEAASSGFAVMNMIPDGENFPLTDLASLRMQFNEPLDASTVTYGSSLSLTDASGELVDAQLLVSGPNLTLDPDEDLTAGEEYTLSLSDEIRSTLGGELDPDRFAEVTFTPLDSNARRDVPLKVVSHNDVRRSALSDELLNSVNLASSLLGPVNQTFLGDDQGPQGDAPGADDLFVDLASVVRFEEVTPLRIKKDQLLTGTEVDVKVAGAQSANLQSGTVEVRFLSDANGFMIPNPHTSSRSAPKNVVLFVDLVLNTEDTTANAALGQELLNVPLVGTVTLEDGALSIEALTVIEPEVMGVDRASGLVSFRLEGYEDSGSATGTIGASTEGPGLASWVPGDNVDSLRPGDPLILYYDKPVRRSSIQDAITLDADGVEQDITVTADGSAVIIRPDEPLRHGVSYGLTVNGIEGLGGLDADSVNETFELVPTEPGTSTEQSPLALTTMPGFACAKTDDDVQPGDTHQGRCAGGKDSDDELPLVTMPADRSILARFSQNMNPDSFVAGETVIMKKNDGSGWTEFDDFSLEVGLRELRIVPLERWEEDTLYRYTLVSDNNGSSANGIESEAGLPLQTQFLTQTTFGPIEERTFGGPDLSNTFKGGPATDAVALPLRNLPTADANADLVLNDSEEGVPLGESDPIKNSAGITVEGVEALGNKTIVDAASINCEPGSDDCVQNNFIYLTAKLDVDVGAEASEAVCENRVADTEQLAPECIPVALQPSLLATTGLDVNVALDLGLVGLLLDVPLSWLLTNPDINDVENVPTGPMFLRIRPDQEADNGFVQGTLHSEMGENGEPQLMFEAQLDVYLDAPYLDPTIGPANLDHNLRSKKLNRREGCEDSESGCGLKLRGPVNFLEDGRMEISLANMEPIDIGVEVFGSVDLVGSGGLCGIWGISFLCNTVVNPLVPADTRINLQIPEGALFINYLSPYTKDLNQ